MRWTMWDGLFARNNSTLSERQPRLKVRVIRTVACVPLQRDFILPGRLRLPSREELIAVWSWQCGWLRWVFIDHWEDCRFHAGGTTGTIYHLSGISSKTVRLIHTLCKHRVHHADVIATNESVEVLPAIGQRASQTRCQPPSILI